MKRLPTTKKVLVAIGVVLVSVFSGTVIILRSLETIAVIYANIFLTKEDFASTRDIYRSTDLGRIWNAIEFHYDDNGRYPDSLEELSPAYMNVIPRDPASKAMYDYRVVDNGYEICVNFEINGRTCYGPKDWYYNRDPILRN